MGLDFICNDCIDIRRIEAGILNAGSDFDQSTTPFDVGLGAFVDDAKGDFLGKKALAGASRDKRQFGLKCLSGELMISGVVFLETHPIGTTTAAALSPHLDHSIGYALLDQAGPKAGTSVRVQCRDGALHTAELVDPPFYDTERLIPRGKRVDIPERPV